MSFTKIGRFLFYIFIFLLPLFYIPNASIPFEVNKTMFLVISLSVMAILGVVCILKEGKYIMKNKVVSIGASLFLLMAAISTIFISSNPVNSFFGENGSADSLIAFLVYAGIFFLAPVFIRGKEEVGKLMVAFVSGISILNLGFLGKVMMGQEAFLPLSSVNVLVILNVIGLTSIFYLYKEEKNPSIKGLLGLSSIILFASFILINFNIGWFVLALASFLIFWGTLLQNNFKKGNLLLLLLTVVSVILFVLNVSFPFEKKVDNQTLGFSDSYNIAKNATFLGSGAVTFDENFLKYNPSYITDSIYYESSSVVFTVLNNFGYLGVLLFLFPFAFAIFKGLNRFLKRKQENLESMSFISLFVLFILLFFYGFDLVLMLSLFLFLSLFLILSEKGKEIVFKTKNPNIIFVNIACLSIVAISVIVLNYFYVLNYLSENYYNLAIEAHLKDRGEGIEYLEKSNSFMEKEKTLIGLSQLYLLKASDLYNESRLLETKEEDREAKKIECEEYMDLSEEKALRAIEINSNDYFSWVNLGNLYSNRRYLRDEELSSQIIEAYTKASELSPYTKEAYVALIQIYSELGNVEMREQYLEKIRVVDPEYLK